MNKLKLSLITSCYNAEKFIDETAESILSQNYDNWEWLISDDFSTDNTYQSIEKISQKDNIRRRLPSKEQSQQG